MKSPEQIADEIIEIMQSAGLTPDRMLEVIKLVRCKLESRQHNDLLNHPHEQGKLFKE